MVRKQDGGYLFDLTKGAEKVVQVIKCYVDSLVVDDAY